MKTYYEDVVLGETARYGAYLVDRDAVIDFAFKFDPQPFHLSDEAAAKTFFGRIAASGWHTCSMTMAMMVEQFGKIGLQSLGSPGVDTLRWPRPVYPGDRLYVEATIVEKRRSQSRPEMGIIRAEQTTFNQHDQAVLTMTVNALVAVRDR